MTEGEILDDLRRFIQDNFLYMKPGLQVSDDDSLLKRGVVDSMGVLEVLTYLDETFGITPGNDEVTEANLGSLRAMARFVASRRAETAG